MSKQGVYKISGNTQPKVGETVTYTIDEWYPATPKEKRNPALVTWHLFKKVDGKFVPTNIKKKGISSFTFQNTAYQNTYRIEAYLHEPEGKAPMALEVQPQQSEVPKINGIQLKYANNTSGNVFNFTEKLIAEAQCTGLEGKYLTFTLWEDDAKDSGHDAKNLQIDSKKEKVISGVAKAQFILASALMKKAIQGETDVKQLEFYVTVEYYENKKHASDNVNINTPKGIYIPPKKPQPKPEPPTSQPKAEGSPAAQKGQSQKEKKGIIETTTETISGVVSEIGKKIYDWAEAKGTAKKDQKPATPPPSGKSPTVVQNVPTQKLNRDGKCFCNRKITGEELKEMVVAMRKATFDESGENFYKWNKDNLFTGGHEQFTTKTYEKFAEVLNKTFENYEIKTCIRKIHFLGQCYHETGAFMKSVEGKKNQEYWYDPYRGRGFIHLTLKGNYQKFKDNSGYDVVNTPTLVSTNIEIAAMSSGWYWKYNDMGDINPFADKDSIFDTSRLVNKPNATSTSSINGYNQRVNAINALKIVFKYPQDCISLGRKEAIDEKTPCSSGIKDCICFNKFTVENGFIKHSRVIKNQVSAIENGLFKDPKTSVQKIILHRTAGGTTEACINAFKNGRKNKKGGIDHYGTHFIVGKDGIITQTANLSKVTWHCAGWNSKSVGIEVVGFAIDKNGKPTLGLKGQNPVSGWENLTEMQAKSVACLVKALLNYYNLDNSKIDCHEHLAPKEAGEGQIVYNAIKDYL